MPIPPYAHLTDKKTEIQTSFMIFTKVTQKLSNGYDQEL